MKNSIIALCCILSFFLVGFNFFKNSNFHIPKDEQVVNKLLHDMAGFFLKKHKLHPIATIVSMPSGVVKKLGLEFQVYGPLSKEVIRKILISCSQELITEINNNLEIRPYLECYPFTIDRIEIGLFIISKDNSKVDYPHIRIAEIDEQRLEYLKLKNTDIIAIIKDRCVESYEDALKALDKG